MENFWHEVNCRISQKEKDGLNQWRNAMIQMAEKAVDSTHRLPDDKISADTSKCVKEIYDMLRDIPWFCK